MRQSGLGHRRPGGGGGGGGGGTTFETYTANPRPIFTPVRTVPFYTLADLQAAVNGAQPGDFIVYERPAGQPNTVVSSSAGVPFTLANKKPGGAGFVIDLGTARSVWDSARVSTDYMKFSYTGSANTPAFWIHDCSNIQIYGGEFTTNKNGGHGIQFDHGLNNVLWWDFWSHDDGNDGIAMFPTAPDGTDATAIRNCNIRGECNQWGWHLAFDPHTNDLGTGLHGANVADTSNKTTGAGCRFYSNRITLYVHDSLTPAQLPPEGSGGAGLEIGAPSGTGALIADNIISVKAVNMNMKPTNGTAGNTINLWGGVPLDGTILDWIEGINLQGAVLHGQPNAGWDNVTRPIQVIHGRHTNTNQTVNAGGNIAVPYDNRYGASIVYGADVL